MKKILLIVGAFPPDACGIGDYSSQLVHSNESGWEYLIWKNWSLKGLVRLLIAINKSKCRYVNLQYPTKSSYGSLIPHLLCIYLAFFSNKRFIVTLHEYMRMGKRYRYAGVLFLLFAYRVVFTTEIEKSYASEIISIRKNRFRVIPIFSNIVKAKCIKPTYDRTCDLAYFGLITPNRNIEKFISLIKILHSLKINIRANIIGMVPDGYTNYINNLREMSSDTSIKFHLNQPNEEVAILLNDCKYTYLPFNDGVSERRGTFYASILNGCIVLTTKGPWTLPKFDKVCYYIDSTNEIELIQKLLFKEEIKITQNDLIKFFKEESVNSWRQISDMYHNICI